MKRSAPPCSCEGTLTASVSQGIKYVSLHHQRPLFLWFMHSIKDNISNLVRIDVDVVVACRIFISSDMFDFFCVRGRHQMTHLSFYFKASFGHHPSMRGRDTLSGLQSCLCAFVRTKCLFYLSVCVSICKITFKVKAASSIFSLSPSRFFFL